MRYITLCAAAAFVLAICVYLFIQVHASPARADGGSSHHVDPPAASVASRAAAPVLAADPAPDSPAPTPSQRVAALEIHRPVLAPSLPPAGEGDVNPVPADVPARPTVRVNGASAKAANPKLDALMQQATKAYDKGETDDAREIAKQALAESPGNIRMLRILVSTACMDSDAAGAKQYYAQLPANDQAQMRTRCDRYGVSFTDPTPAPAP